MSKLAIRKAEIARKTTETDITLALDIDGSGRYDIKTGVGFFDHMLELFTRHGRFDLTLRCNGDNHVDDHHTVEDVAIALGAAFSAAIGGEKRGIYRYGSFILPMDEALVLTAVDISGRATLVYNLNPPTTTVGNFDTQLAREFFEAITRSMNITLHINQLAGFNSHHIIEAAFKGFARALSAAVAIDPLYSSEIPSTKGVL